MGIKSTLIQIKTKLAHETETECTVETGILDEEILGGVEEEWLGTNLNAATHILLYDDKILSPMKAPRMTTGYCERNSY